MPNFDFSAWRCVVGGWLAINGKLPTDVNRGTEERSDYGHLADSRDAPVVRFVMNRIMKSIRLLIDEYS